MPSTSLPISRRPRARLAYERHTNGGLPWLDPIRGEHASEVGAANQRLSPRQRMTLALRDLEGRPDDEIALALGADTATVAALVARARLRLRDELELPEPASLCRDRLAALSAYVDDTLPADRRGELEAHVADCPGCRSALFALQEAALRYRSLPVPVPPGELRSRTTVALGAIGFPTRRPRALAPDPAPGSGGRPMAAAAAMAALVVVGAGVTILASRNGPDRGEPTRAPATSPATRSANAVLRSTDRADVLTPAVTVAQAAAPEWTPPLLRHLRAGSPRPARGTGTAARAARANRPGPPPGAAAIAPPAPPPAALAPPPPPAPPAPPSPLKAPPENPKKVPAIPVQILPPVAPPHTPATADAPPPPPEPPPPADPAGPAQTTST